MSKKLFFIAIQNYKVNNKKDTYAHSMYYCRERERVRFLVRTYKHSSFVYVLENFKLYTLIEQDVKILLSRNNRMCLSVNKINCQKTLLPFNILT